ncbi:MAG TPA: ATP-binding protein [bacterium]|nr:ATP-binding protein [bacterium]HQL61941.1 ATP-binding protein [bacterium]
MLIEFAVTNYRSFRDRQVLSLVASNRDKTLPDNLIELDLPGLKNTKLVKSVAVYGANASGKSNLIKAMKFMRDFVEKSASELKPGEETGVEPFRLDSQKEQEPSEFEVIFVHEGVRYQYGFALDKKRVYEEWLIAYPQGQPQRWFERRFDPDSGKYDWNFGSKYKGERRSLKDRTRENALFLSVAAQFNHEQLSMVYQWFGVFLRFMDFSRSDPSFDGTIRMMLAHKSLYDLVGAMITLADLGITEIQIQEFKPDEIPFPDAMPRDEREKTLRSLGDKKVVDIRMKHCMNGEEKGIYFSLDEESAGTLKYFSLLGPWLLTLKLGCTICIDEIAAKIHPSLVRNLIRYMQSPKVNLENAQLVLTTHDTTLLDVDLFRRDQIWFTEKNDEGATVLYPLTDYKPRPDEALQKGYLAGRYGAIPFLGDFPFK